ncbi:60S ribosomal protein L7 [Entomophthora muscae]|uniref:60S ribosomal protein L7 n=1 Tax=Entomophthora muscae TaxID=34485 RepID=A0ACC2RHI8_9FUNG|nr:60S ribosomal protein L7 [Entomophthora muscae]
MSKVASKVLKPESLLKKEAHIKSDDQIKADKLAKKEDFKAKQKVIYARAKKYAREYKAQRNNIRNQVRQAKESGNFFVPAQPKLAFVIRTKGINKLAPKPRKILQLLRLLQINNGVFVRLTKATKQMLQLIEPYVTYGEPSLKTIKEIIYKRGHGKVKGQRIRLSDNAIVEKNLGKYGIICLEDIVHEIATVGPHFKQVSNFLWPVKLSSPNGGFKGKKAVHFIMGGESGDRETAINSLVKKMN